MKLLDFSTRIIRKNSANETDIPLTISSKDGLINQNDFFNKQVASKDMSGYYLLHRGEYAYNKSYSVGYDFGSIKRLEKYDMGALSTLYICFALTKFNSDFIKHYFDSFKWYREIYMISAEGARNHGLLNVPTEDFFATLHTLPTDETEQAKIASFLDALTSRIEKQRSLVENLKKYKRGVIEAVFNRKIRFASEDGTNSWKEYRLSDFACRITRKNGQSTDIPLTISAQYGLIDQREFFSKTVASTDMSGYYLLNNGEFAYNRSTSSEYPYGSIKRLEKYSVGAVSTLYLCFGIRDEIMESDMIKWYFESSLWHNGIREICAEGARNHGLLNIPTDGFFNTIHYLPSNRSEQETIAKFLTAIEERYMKALSELDALHKMKKFLYHQLFI